VTLKDGKASSNEDFRAIEYGCGCGLPRDMPSVRLSPKQRIWSELAKSILTACNEYFQVKSRQLFKAQCPIQAWEV
jgi:hypothetical protein